ncbi:hypothetical protein GCM10025868_42030 [Angustibacter aerolatus]|uniref:Luciferase-like domain-containing protein n=1 Tax=Angustibacter aerolatus TaxID=1162965 RepID=A0ABQ6JNK3_9ACTN|nr:hypothetical protein GCM10025868_42030 [Angustibacter aerolatus]
MRPEDFEGRMVISADPDVHRAEIQRFVDLGFDRVYLHNVGRNQREWIDVFGREVLPKPAPLGRPPGEDATLRPWKPTGSGRCATSCTTPSGGRGPRQSAAPSAAPPAPVTCCSSARPPSSRGTSPRTSTTRRG